MMGLLQHLFPILLVLLFNLSGTSPQLCNQTLGVSTIQLSPSPFRGSVTLNPGTPSCSSTPLVCSINDQDNLLFDDNIGPEQPNFDDIDDRFMFFASNSEASSYISFQMSEPLQMINSIDLYLMYNPAESYGIPNFRLYATDSLSTIDPAEAGTELKYDILNIGQLSINHTARVRVTLRLSSPLSSPVVLLFWEFMNLFRVNFFLLSEIKFCGDTQPEFQYDIVEIEHPTMDEVITPSAEVLTNGSLLLNCTVSNEGSIIWRWRKGQSNLRIGPKISMQTADANRTSILTIKQLKFIDANIYSCEATYKHLESYSTRRYNVEFPTIIEGVPQVDGFSGDGSVTLMCEMYGYATTSDPITWSNSNGETLTDDTSKFSIMDSEGSKMIIYSNGDTGESIVSVLTINDLTLEDTGNYTCDTENGIERQSATTQVLIYAGTSPPTTSEAPTTTTSPEMIGSATDQTGVIAAAVVVSLVVIAIIVSIIIILIILLVHPRKTDSSSSLVRRRKSSVNDSSEMERRLTVTKVDIEWQIPHEQNGDIVANGGDVSALYASVDKGTPPVPSQNFLETDFNDPSSNVYAEACSPKSKTSTETTKDDLWLREDNTDPNDPQMNIYEEAGSPRVKKTLDVALSDPQLNIYAEAGDPTTNLNDSLYAEAKPQRRMTNSSTPKLTKLKKTPAANLLDQNPIYESTGNIPTESDTQVLVQRDPSTVVYAQPSIKRKNSASKEKPAETSEPVYSEALTPALFKEPANATESTSLQPYGPVYALPTIVKKSQDTVKKIDSAHFQEQRLIGVGQFGEVALAKTIHLSHRDLNLAPFDDDRSVTIKVAIKKLRSDAESSLRESFDKEIKFMSKLKNDNIVCLQAISSGSDPFIVMEYMENGDLHQFLEDYDSMVMHHSPELGQISISVLVNMAVQISSGMKYLASHNYVHRDLATRNCLVGDDYIVKIADFGMSRNLYAESYYKVRGRAMLPIRWMATESFFGRFSEKTDIWSFGVVMWEIFTLCKQPPYEELGDQEIIQNAIGGEGRILLDKPVGCPRSVYDVMLRCWEQRTQERAGFVEVFNSLSAIHRSM